VAESGGETVNGIDLTREFDAPRERVWREWTEPEAFADWFGGPEGVVPLDSVTMDVRVGGAWRLTMIYEGREMHWKGEYQELVEPERLVLTMSDQPGDDVFELITVELRELDDGRTEMRVSQRGHLTPEMYERAGAGWTGFFDRIAERLAGS
jgi:uncharacterized protein YndB with AHSA1/START domain